MMRGSVAVRPGQAVALGEVIGRVGFSGSVYTVHLHYEMGTGPGVDVDGLPAYFSGFRRVLGRRVGPVERGSIDTGDIVEQP
jgi:murein DD-endopeptidase MepM/ murein hydrolase activator NlpD